MSGSQSNNWRQNDNWRSPGPSSARIPDVDTPGPGVSRRDTRQPAANRQPPPDTASEASASIAEGRRVYLGNLLYRVRPDEIEDMLQREGFGADLLDAIHISVAPVTGRNPGYCFIDFTSREAADRALGSLGGVLIQGRPAKVGPCVPKGAERRWKSADYSPTFNSWGDWKGSREARDEGAPLRCEQGPYGAIDHIRDMRTAAPPPRVYVGGLGKMINQETHDREVRGYFEGHKIIAISKRITPDESTRKKPGNHHYCFVDFETVEEAQAAVESLRGRVVPGGQRLRVQMAKGINSEVSSYG